MRGSETAANAACHAFQSVRDPEGRVGPVSLLLEGEKTGFSQHCVIDLQFRAAKWPVSHPEHVSKPSHQRTKENRGPPSRRGQKSTYCPSLHLLLILRRRRRAHTRAPEMLRLSNAPSLHIAAARRRRPHHTHAPKRDATTITHLKQRTPSTRNAHRRRELGPPLLDPGSFPRRRPRRRLRGRLEHDADGPGVAAH